MASIGRTLTIEDIRALEIGAAILGTGGGGNPRIGRLRTEQLLKAGKKLTLIPLSALADEDIVVSVGGIGAPVVGIEKIERGDECYRAMRAVERAGGKPVTALISGEIGGANSMEPMITAAQAELPVVDGDGMGRAFPELQMCTFFVYGLHPSPAAIADEKDNVVVFTGVKDMYWLERLSRATAVDMGATAGYATPPMRGEFVRRFAVPGTVTQAIDLGQAVFDARKRKENPVQAILRACHGVALFEGKIVDLDRRLARGFAVGRATLHGLGPYSGSELMIDLQNENLIAIRDGVPVATVPDLICMVDLETGEAITTEVLRYGLRVAVLGLPCHDLMRTPEALRVFGPRAFGYDLDFHPLPQGGA
ncbi:MAG TPA: DUF917 domain-containing protein [Chloroflexota bacterium]|nr:DUF917 domain-containing protein [Chloroflexota bacterium]